jgi:glucuronoarabinoxylan endo-1,4-beta-xylanase
VRTTSEDERGLVAPGLRDGSWLRWTNVNFADGSAAGFPDQKGQLRLHAHVRPTTPAGATIDVRIGAPDGPAVGTLEVPPATGEWMTATTWIDTSRDGGAHGFQHLYLVVRADAGSAERTSLLDLDLVEFSD